MQVSQYVSPCSLFKFNPLCFIYLLQICQQEKVKVGVLCVFFLLLTALLEFPGDICWIRLRHFTMVQTEGIKFQGHECLTSMDGMKN